MNGWELIFMQSPINNGYYEETELPQQNWRWPQGTWFQTRLSFVRESRPPLNLQSNPTMSRPH